MTAAPSTLLDPLFLRKLERLRKAEVERNGRWTRNRKPIARGPTVAGRGVGLASAFTEGLASAFSFHPGDWCVRPGEIKI